MATEDLIRGLQGAIGSYVQADESRQAREDRRKQLADELIERRADRDARYRSSGLIPEYDESGYIKNVSRDPSVDARELKDIANKSIVEGKILEPGDDGLLKFKGWDPGFLEGYAKMYQAKSEANPLAQAIKGADLQKKLKEINDPTFSMSEPEKKMALDSASKLSDTLTIKDSMDGVIGVLDDPNVSEEQKVIAAKGALKLINSATLSSPDAVGKDEAERAGSFISPGLMNLMPGQPGPGPLSKPNVEAFAEQLKIMSKNLGSKAGSLQKRSGIKQGSGLLEKSAPQKPSATPGSVINVNGKRFRVGNDGESLEPI